MLASLRNAVIFRLDLLAYSETFIREQGERLGGFSAHYAGLRRIPGLELPAERVCVAAHAGFAAKPLNFLHKLGLPHPRLLRRMEAIRPALIHAHFESDGICAMAFAEALNIPLITTGHGYDITVHDRDRRLPERLVDLRRAEFQRKGRLFIAVSGFIRDKMIERGYPAERVVLHHIGVDTDFFRPPERPERERVILFVGRLVEKKGTDDLLAASLLLQKKGVSHRVVIIGGGPMESGLRGTVARENLPVEFAGRQTPEQIRQWMERAVVFCLPSKQAANGDCEGLPIVICEALAMGMTVVSTRHSGIPEAVRDEETGLLAPERSPEILAEQLERALTDETLAQELSSRGRARVVEHFDLKTQCRKLEALYQGVL